LHGNQSYSRKFKRFSYVNVDTVVIDGRILKYKGELTRLDAAEVIRKAAESFAAVRKRAGGPY
jgi:hypothetical protein